VSRSTLLSRPWLDIALRSALAILGGYAFTYAFTAALARLLPLPRFDAVMIATEIAFIVYLAYLLWSFAGVSLRRLALVTATGTLGLALIGFWPQLLERLG
jgi:hypothetical protein